MFRLLADFVETNWGPPGLEQILEQAGWARKEDFRLDGCYPDEVWRKLFDAALDLSGLPGDEVEMAFARYCAEDLVLRFAGFFQGATSAREIIRRQPAIHNFIAASLRDEASRKAVADKFRLEERPEETVVHYVSPNRHCVLYRGLAQWAAEFFVEEIEIDEPRCLKRGDQECEIHVRFLGRRHVGGDHGSRRVEDSQGVGQAVG